MIFSRKAELHAETRLPITKAGVIYRTCWQFWGYHSGSLAIQSCRKWTLSQLVSVCRRFRRTSANTSRGTSCFVSEDMNPQHRMKKVRSGESMTLKRWNNGQRLLKCWGLQRASAGTDMRGSELWSVVCEVTSCSSCHYLKLNSREIKSLWEICIYHHVHGHLWTLSSAHTVCVFLTFSQQTLFLWTVLTLCLCNGDGVFSVIQISNI